MTGHDVDTGGSQMVMPPTGHRMSIRRNLAQTRSDRGAAVSWFPPLLIVLLTVSALSVDMWMTMSERRAVAGIVDSAAAAGATAIDVAEWRNSGQLLLDEDHARQRAADSLGEHTDTVDTASITISVDRTDLEVSATSSVELLFARFAGMHTTDVTATAVGRPHDRLAGG